MPNKLLKAEILIWDVALIAGLIVYFVRAAKADPAEQHALKPGYIAVGVGWCGLLALGQQVGRDVALSRLALGFVGAWLGALTIPLLIAYVVSGRKREWHSFSRWFFWLALLLPTLLFRSGPLSLT